MTSRADRIVFAGTPAFAATILQRLLQGRAPVVGVLTQPDRPSGRGRKLMPSPVKTLAQDHDLAVQQPVSLRDDDALTQLAELQPDLMIVAAYGLILPRSVLELPVLGCWNVHASLLPRWRGAAPVERAIMAGDRETGTCIMQMDAGLDTGPVRHCRAVPIRADMTGGELEAALAELGSEALLEVLADAGAERFAPCPQASEGVTYAHKLQRQDSLANFHVSAQACADQIRALNPKMPVTASAAGTSMKLLQATALTASSKEPPGTILRLTAEGLDVACREGVLRIQQARIIRGKAAIMDAPTLARTAADLLQPGARLEQP